MHVEVIDADARTYRCQHGEFSEIPTPLPSGPPPAVIAVSHWTGVDPRIERREVGGEKYADLTHDGTVWTYKLSLAYTLDTEGAGYWQIAQGFDVGVLAD